MLRARERSTRRSVVWVIEVRVKGFFKEHGGYGNFEITGYWDPVIYSEFMNSELIKLCVLDEGVFQKVKCHNMLFSGFLNPEA